MSIHERGELASGPMCVRPRRSARDRRVQWRTSAMVRPDGPRHASSRCGRRRAPRADHGSDQRRRVPPSIPSRRSDKLRRAAMCNRCDPSPSTVTPTLRRGSTISERLVRWCTSLPAPSLQQLRCSRGRALSRPSATFDVDVVATVGLAFRSRCRSATFRRNVRVERFVPQQFILEKASVVISHAGPVPCSEPPRTVCRSCSSHCAPISGRTPTQPRTRESRSRWSWIIVPQTTSATRSRQMHERATGSRPRQPRLPPRSRRCPRPTDHVATIEALVDGGSSDG